MSDGGSDRLVYTVLEVIHTSGAGVRLHVEDAAGDDLIEWFPLSQVDYDTNELVIPRWLALEKGLGGPIREA